MRVEQGTAPADPQVKQGAALESAAEPFWLGVDRKWWVLAAVGISTFMTAIGSSIVNALVPLIMADLRIDFATAEWITMVYLLVVSGLLLTFGRLADMIGHKRVFLMGFGVFTVGSALCALSPTASVLIPMRAFQAIGYAMLYASSSAILTATFPPSQRGQALGMQGTWTYLGLMVGPALGGYLTDQFGWRSTFLINVPLGVFAIALAYLAIVKRQAPAHGERFDPAGALTFMAGLMALLLVLSHGQDWGWTSPVVLGLLVFSLVLLAAFVLIELRIAHPMLDLGLFRARVFSTSTVSALMNYISIYAVMFLVPFYLIQYRGMTPGHSGLLLAAQALTMAVAAPLSGSLSDRIGSRFLSSLGMGIMTVSLLLLGTLSPTAGEVDVTIRLMLVGLGAGIFVSPNSSALMGSAPKHRQGVASGVLSAARSGGMVLGIAVAGAVFSASLAARNGVIGPGPAFLPAFRDTFLVVALFSAAGVVTSLARGRRLPAPQAAAEQPGAGAQ